MLSVTRGPVDSRHLWLRQDCGALGFSDLHRRLVAEIVAAVGILKGERAAEIVAAGGLESLHTAIESTDFGPLRDTVIEKMRPDLLRMAVAIGRDLLRWADEFYVDDYLILRINFPYEAARQGGPAGENPGIGRVSPSVRELARSRRTIDPVYDPKGYHNNLPPAAWAHGPHQDSWAGHSEDGLNIWWAMCDTPAEAGMVLYPELAGKELPREPKTLYLKAGYALPKPTLLPLAAGDMLIFDPEILHGTHLNVSPRTRVAVSLRLNAKQPRFSPDCFYAREFWRRASDIEQERLDAVMHLKREEHLAAPPPPRTVEWPERLRTIQVDYTEDGAPIRLGPSSSIAENERVLVQLSDRRVLVHRVDGALAAIDARCPHYAIDLSDGAADRERVFCPGCGVAFNLITGASSAPSLTLERIPVQEDDAGILLLLQPSRQTEASAAAATASSPTSPDAPVCRRS